MELTARFRMMASVLHWIVTLLMLGVLTAVLVFFAFPEFARSTLVEVAPRGLPIQTLPTTGVIYALLLVGSVSAAVQLFVMWQMRALLRLYANGDALSQACAGRISRIGVGLLVLPLTAIFYRSASSVLLTLGNAAGERQLSVGIGLPELASMIGGGTLLLIGAAMLEAARQADENRSFV